MPDPMPPTTPSRRIYAPTRESGGSSRPTYAPTRQDVEDPLRHHGDVEATAGLLDLAVNVYPEPRPTWLDEVLRASLDDVGRYPDPTGAQAAVAAHHGVEPDRVLLTAGAAEAFSLVARGRWRGPAVVHPQFTEPHAALEQAGHAVTPVVLPRPFTLDPAAVPADADLVVVGNPTNPTGVLHPASAVLALRRRGRLVVVDEAFMDTVPGETESVLGESGVLVVRSLTKHWSIPGIRAGYVVGDPDLLSELRRHQVPWSVSTTAIAASTALASVRARRGAGVRAQRIGDWRTHLEKGLADLGVDHVPSATSFVLARVGVGVHAALRDAGVAVRRADTFPGLDGAWVRIAVRPTSSTDTLLRALRDALG
jgi:histidinol-phosphate/aromatic aminotransferase/cobyric acid decarboxylase-like protein